MKPAPTTSALWLTVVLLAGCGSSETESAPEAAPAPETARPASSVPEPSERPMHYDEFVRLLAEPDPFKRIERLAEWLPTLDEASLPAVREILAQAGHLELDGAEYGLLMSFWSLYEPAEAANFALSDSPRGYRVTSTHAAVTRWFQVDPEAALPAVQTFAQQPNDWGAAAQIAMVRGWYESGQPGLLDYIHGLGDSFERQRALRAYANAVVRRDGAEKVVEWVESIDRNDDRYRLEAYRAAGKALAAFDVAAAVAFCDAHCEEEHGANLRTLIAERWVRHDPGAALEWLATSPEGQDTSFAIRSTYATWAMLNPDPAVAWFKKRTENGMPEWLTPAVPVYSSVAGEKDAQEGIKWASTIEDERDREWAIAEVARKWWEREPEQAEAWLERDDTPLSEEMRRRVRTPGSMWRSGVERDAKRPRPS